MASHSKDVRNDVRNLLDYLLTAEIAVETNLLDSRDVGLITWTPRPGAGRPFSFNERTTFAEYQEWLADRQYSALLYDGSLLQITYYFDGSEISGHRLAYVPCPVIVEGPISNVDDLLDFATLENCHVGIATMQTILRFDFDPKAERPDHPASHATLNRSSCRIPVRSWMSVGTFVDVVFRHMYPEQWFAHPFLRSLSKGLIASQTPRFAIWEAPERVHLNWRN